MLSWVIWIVGQLLVLWFVAEWAVWHSLKRYFSNLRFDDEHMVDSPDVRQGSSIGMAERSDGDFWYVQENGTLARTSSAEWSDESISGRDDHE